MEYIIHLTNRCNLRCKYCYENKKDKDIEFENIKNLIDYEIGQNSKNSVICFYGGEPLLKKDLIEKTVDYVKEKERANNFYFVMTTNGTLIDDKFIGWAKENNFIGIALSFDGIQQVQDMNRVYLNGNGTFEIVERNAKKLLEDFERVNAMLVVTKNNLSLLSESVSYLISLGFKTINIQFDYLNDWKSEDLPKIKEKFMQVASIYEQRFMEEKHVNIPIIDDKIKAYIQKEYNCNKCQFGMKSVNVDTDGNIYPCMQFVGNEKYIIGNCKEGIDCEARLKLINNAKKEKDVCKNCSINKRCNHTCACKNYVITGDINELSPLVCETERIFVEVADQMAERLYRNDSNLFIQKYYNKNYDYIIDLINTKEKKNYGNKEY